MARKKEMNFRPFRIFHRDVEYFKLHKKNFQHKSSSNSGQIICKDLDIHTTYTDSRIPEPVLFFTPTLKKELKPHLDFFTSSLGKSEYMYNHTNKKYDFENNETIYFDIKAAYLTFLYNSGKLQERTFKKIMSFQKKHRLITLGLLAYQPETFYYHNGELVYSDVKKNEFRDVFFYCVKKTSDVMKACMAELGMDFAFFWVDGIFFKKTDRNIEVVTNILDSENLNYKIEETEIVSVVHDEGKGIKLEIKYKGEKEPKHFFLPERESEESRIFRQEMRKTINEKLDKQAFDILAQHYILDKKGRILF